VDQGLVAYFDRSFSALRSEITTELRAELTANAAQLQTELAANATELRAENVASAAQLQTLLRAEIAASAAETRRHFDVVADHLMDKIQLVGEGVIGVDQKLDRFRGEVTEELRRVDQRLLRLEARATG
jgi:putative hemolysin